MTIWCTRIALWITIDTLTQTHIHSEYVMFIASPPQQWFQENASMLLSLYYVYVLLKYRSKHDAICMQI
jgi:hypothetical protein